MLEKLFSVLCAIQYCKVDEIKIGNLRAFSISHDTYALIIPNADFFITVRVIGSDFIIPISAFRSFLFGAVGSKEVLGNGLIVSYREGNTTLGYQLSDTELRIEIAMTPRKIISIKGKV